MHINWERISCHTTECSILMSHVRVKSCVVCRMRKTARARSRLFCCSWRSFGQGDNRCRAFLCCRFTATGGWCLIQRRDKHAIGCIRGRCGSYLRFAPRAFFAATDGIERMCASREENLVWHSCRMESEHVTLGCCYSSGSPLAVSRWIDSLALAAFAFSISSTASVPV